MKKGFTLAEVLLTLAIIGVIAALTIPAVITKVTQDQYAVGLKKAFNTFKAVEREAIQEHGDMENWDWALNQSDSVAFFKRYFLPYFDVLKDCGSATDEGCFAEESQYRYVNGSVINPQNMIYSFIASDGIAYAYRSNSYAAPGRQGLFLIDVNGQKKPNIVGRDMFAFEIFSNIGIKPHGQIHTVNGTTFTSEVVNADCSTGTGWHCTAKVLSEGAMNY